MTLQEINIAIAESLGWTIFHRNDKGEIKSWKSPDGSIWQEPWTPLRFAEDLNAMHEVEKTMPILYRNCYIDNLVILILGKQAQVDGSYAEQWATLNATALQRAEAYLRTIGKWNEKD